jgi:hypothetical protein
MLQVIWLDFQLFNQSYKLVTYCSVLIIVSEHFQIVGLYFDLDEHFLSYKLHVFILLFSSYLYI